jgi:hypothetical protein
MKLILVLSLFLLLAGCGGDEMQINNINLPSIKDIPNSSWEKLSQKKIYFGHQSVGFNIVDGIRDVMREHPEIKLNIIESFEDADLRVGTFEHSRVGKNTDPQSKVDEFARFLERGIGNKADFAAVKFCYVDVRADTDVNGVFKGYMSRIAELKKKYPDTTIIHFTVPLTVSRTSWKTVIKKILGRKTWEYDDNIKRNEYNQLLLKTYGDKEPVFYLARVESTYPGGRRCTFIKHSKTYYSLVPEYTTDGGHLNEKGRKIVAEQLLIFLAKLAA